jgi:hypothetical protein
MARIMLQGDFGTVELTRPDDGGVKAICLAEDCDWTEDYDTVGDAVEYAADHVDPGPRRCLEGG